MNLTALYPSLPDLIAALLWLGIAFVAGVGFAAYRAVGWVDRMRAWASSSVVDEKDS